MIGSTKLSARPLLVATVNQEENANVTTKEIMIGRAVKRALCPHRDLITTFANEMKEFTKYNHGVHNEIAL